MSHPTKEQNSTEPGDDAPAKAATPGGGTASAPEARASVARGPQSSNPLDDSAKWLESARRDRQNAIDLAKRYQAENSRLQAEITQLRAELQGVRLGAEGMGWAPRSPVETDSALPQLRRIDRAARAFVDAFDGDAVQDYLEQECAAEWKELNEALFDGRTAQETCGKPFGDDVREYRCTEPAGHSGPCKQSPLKASEPRELTASEAASFSKTLARSPRRIVPDIPRQLLAEAADRLRGWSAGAEPDGKLIRRIEAYLASDCPEPCCTVDKPPPVKTTAAINRGLCATHSWGAPPGQDDLECPYCNGTLRTKS